MEEELEREMTYLANKANVGKKKKLLNEDLADVKAKIDTNKPLTKADIKQKQLEDMKAVQEAALVEPRFRKMRKNRNETTLE